MKKTFFAGLLLLIPISLTYVILAYIVDMITNPILNCGILKADFLKLCPIICVRAIILVFIFGLILLMGFLGKLFIFKPLFYLFERMIMKVPVVKTLYKLFREITTAMIGNGETLFKKSVTVPFPVENSKALGFQTGTLKAPLSNYFTKQYHSVFVPTAPHPISGFLLLTPDDEMTELEGVTVEQSFKFILSCGMLHPGETSPPTANK